MRFSRYKTMTPPNQKTLETSRRLVLALEDRSQLGSPVHDPACLPDGGRLPLRQSTCRTEVTSQPCLVFLTVIGAGFGAFALAKAAGGGRLLLIALGAGAILILLSDLISCCICSCDDPKRRARPRLVFAVLVR